MEKSATELVVITKMYALVVWGCQHVARFPRTHKFTVGDRLAIRLQELFDLLVRAKYERERGPLLRQANLDLELLRLQLRLAKDPAEWGPLNRHWTMIWTYTPARSRDP